jgi:hypothetical protein
MPELWRIVNQRPYDKLVAGGQFRPVVEITYELPSINAVATVTVDRADYSPEVVREIINNDAKTHLDIRNLTP